MYHSALLPALCFVGLRAVESELAGIVYGRNRRQYRVDRLLVFASDIFVGIGIAHGGKDSRRAGNEADERLNFILQPLYRFSVRQNTSTNLRTGRGAGKQKRQSF